MAESIRCSPIEHGPGAGCEGDFSVMNRIDTLCLFVVCPGKRTPMTFTAVDGIIQATFFQMTQYEQEKRCAESPENSRARNGQNPKFQNLNPFCPKCRQGLEHRENTCYFVIWGPLGPKFARLCFSWISGALRGVPYGAPWGQ